MYIVIVVFFFFIISHSRCRWGLHLSAIVDPRWTRVWLDTPPPPRSAENCPRRLVERLRGGAFTVRHEKTRDLVLVLQTIDHFFSFFQAQLVLRFRTGLIAKTRRSASVCPREQVVSRACRLPFERDGLSRGLYESVRTRGRSFTRKKRSPDYTIIIIIIIVCLQTISLVRRTLSYNIYT